MESTYIAVSIISLLFTMIGVPIIIAVIAKKNEKNNHHNVTQTFSKIDHASLQFNTNPRESVPNTYSQSVNNQKTPSNFSTSSTSDFDKDFIKILHKMAAERGFSVFMDIPKCKSLLHDFAAGKYKKECRLLLLAVESGCPVEIANSTDYEITKKKLTAKLHNFCSMEYSIAEQVILMLHEVHIKILS